MAEFRQQPIFSTSTSMVLAGILASVLLALLVGYSYYWNADNIRAEQFKLALSEAKSNWNKDASFRQWATGHGGVYVEPNERTPRSTSLSHLPDRDVVTTDGRELTLMNPAYMLRQMTEEYEEAYGIKGKITGKLQLNPINKPDDWQLMVLNVFESGETDEVYEQQIIDGQPYLRYMKAMYMTEGCVKCHGILGFKDGDLRGGVSVSIPLLPYFDAAEQSNRGILVTHFAVASIGLALIAGFVLLMRRSLLRVEGTMESLRLSERRFRELVASAPDSMVITNQRGEIEIVNKQLESMTGYEEGELLGKPIETLIPPRFVDHTKLLKDYVANPVDVPMRGRLDLFCRTKDGRDVPVEISLSSLQTDEGSYFTAVIRDVTESRNAEQERVAMAEQLAQSRKMEAIGQLTGGIAHDFNNVLQSILGFSGMAKDVAQGLGDAKLENYLDRIIVGSGRAGKLVDDLLVFGRGENLVVERPVLIAEAIQHSVALLRGTIPSSVEIRLDVEDHLPHSGHQVLGSMCVFVNVFITICMLGPM